MDGHLVQQWETAILRMLKAKGADLSNSKIAGKFDGYSEAWSKSTFEVRSIKELMRLTEEFPHAWVGWYVHELVPPVGLEPTLEGF